MRARLGNHNTPILVQVEERSGCGLWQHPGTSSALSISSLELSDTNVYRGTSLIRNNPPVGWMLVYSRPVELTLTKVVKDAGLATFVVDLHDVHAQKVCYYICMFMFILTGLSRIYTDSFK